MVARSRLAPAEDQNVHETIVNLSASILAGPLQKTIGLRPTNQRLGLALWSNHMRNVIFAATLLFTSFNLPAEISRADANPYIRLTQVVKNGTIRVTAKNISRKPIVAYVVALQDGSQSTTHHDFFTGRDAFAPGKTIELVFAVHSSSDPKLFVDYVRLADNSTWGNAVTDAAKDVAASFQN
jgi:hypothetical protein